MDEMAIELNSEKYADFLRCITMIGEVCNDVEIREGIIRQRTNGNFSAFEIDATPVVGDLSLVISHLKFKLPLFNTFNGQDVMIEVNEDESTTFKDNMSSIRFIKPSMQFLQNKFMDERERDSIFVFKDENLILSCDLNNTITDRIKTISKVFQVDSIQVEFDGDVASIKAQTQARDQFAMFKDGIITNMEIEKAHANIVSTPFTVDHDNNIEFMIYREPNPEQEILISNFRTTLGDMDIRIFTRSPLLFEEDDSDE